MWEQCLQKYCRLEQLKILQYFFFNLDPKPYRLLDILDVSK